MMLYPPIDKLVDKVGCKYALSCLISRRARFLISKKPDFLAETEESAVTLAAKELYDSKIKVAYED
jgi:DNA-directed RNA polymerase omega subunit